MIIAHLKCQKVVKIFKAKFKEIMKYFCKNLKKNRKNC